MLEVISNTSPLQYLYQTNLLELLPTLYGRIRIPQAVADELEEGFARGIHLPRVAELPWLQVESVPVLPGLTPDLGLGELEVLALAMRTQDALAVLDDALARRHARLLRIRYTGTLGVLLKAKESGHLAAVAPVLTQLEHLRFRLDAKTLSSVLHLAGE